MRAVHWYYYMLNVSQAVSHFMGLLRKGGHFCFFNFGSLWTAVAQSSEVEADGQFLFCKGVASPKCKNWGPTEREADGRKEWRVYMAMTTTVLPHCPFHNSIVKNVSVTFMRLRDLPSLGLDSSQLTG